MQWVDIGSHFLLELLLLFKKENNILKMFGVNVVTHDANWLTEQVLNSSTSNGRFWGFQSKSLRMLLTRLQSIPKTPSPACPHPPDACFGKEDTARSLPRPTGAEYEGFLSNAAWCPSLALSSQSPCSLSPLWRWNFRWAIFSNLKYVASLRNHSYFLSLFYPR